MQHFGGYAQISPEQQGVFRGKKVAALIAKSRNVDTPPTDRLISVFHHDALVAGGWKGIVDQIGKSGFQVKDGIPFRHQNPKLVAAGAFFLPGKRESGCVRVGGMEVEGNSPHRVLFPRRLADRPDRTLVDLIDRHIKAEVVGGCAGDIFQNRPVGISADCIVTGLIPVQAQKNQIGFRQIERVSAVGHDVDDQKADFPCLGYQITQRPAGILPEKGFAAAEEKNPDSLTVEQKHLLTNRRIGIDHRSQIVDRAMPAMEVAAVGQDDGAQDCFFAPEQNGADSEPAQPDQGGWFHRFSPNFLG